MLRQIFRAIAREVYEALRPIELPRLPDEVSAELLGKGYRWEHLPSVAAQVGVSKCFMQLLSPAGHYICSSTIPPEVRNQYISDARAAYEKCGLPVPFIVPGTENSAGSPAHEIRRSL